MATKRDLNNVLNSKTINDVYSPDVIEEANRITDISRVNKSTLVGRSINDVWGGLEGQEVKTDNNGEVETRGETIVRLTEGVPGIGTSFDTTTQIAYSTPVLSTNLTGFDSNTFNGLSDSNVAAAFSVFDPTGGDTLTPVNDIIASTSGFNPTSELGNIQYGSTSMEAVKAMTEDAAAKAAALEGDVLTSVASSIFDTVNKTADTAALQNTFSAGVANVSQLAQQASSVSSINPSASLLENVQNSTGISSLLAPVIDVINTVETSLDNISDEINAGLENISTAFGDLSADFSDFLSKSSITTGGGVLQDIYEDLTRTVSESLNQLAFPTIGISFSNDELSELVTNINNGNINEVVTTINQRSSSNSAEMQSVIDSVLADGDPVSIEQFIEDVTARATSDGIDQTEIDYIQERVKAIEEAVVQLNSTISGSLVMLRNSYYQEDYDMTYNVQKFKGSSTAFDAFTYIDSKEELGAEIKNIIRDVNEVIIHATETYTNSNIGCEEVHVLHNENGFDGIQYHYVIRRDGRLQRGRPADKSSDASSVNSHNIRCLDIALVGGLNCPSGTENPTEYRSAQSFTRVQMATLEAFLEAFYRRYPGGQVMGHNDISSLDADPYFDVVEYVNTLFRKQNVYTDTLTETAYTSSTLITKEP